MDRKGRQGHRDRVLKGQTQKMSEWVCGWEGPRGFTLLAAVCRAIAT
jgi:hypothetical protein